MRRTPRAGRATRCWTSGWAGRSATPSPWSAASATRRTASTRCTSAAAPPTSVRRARRMSRCAWRSEQRRDAMHAKRWLFLIHRWLGVVLCAFFAMWFVSGVGVMYVCYPKLTQPQPLHTPPPPHAPPPARRSSALAGAAPGARCRRHRRTPERAAAGSGQRRARGVSGAACTQGRGRPAPPAAGQRHGGDRCRNRRRAARRGPPPPPPPLPTPTTRPPPPPGSGTVVIDAEPGAVLRAVARARVRARAQAYAGAGVPIDYHGAIGEDAFTHSRRLDGHRPLHVADLGDAQATRLYVSGKTGEVVRDAPRAERLWNY